MQHNNYNSINNIYYICSNVHIVCNDYNIVSKNIISEFNYRVSAVFVKPGCKCQHCPNREVYPGIHDDGTNCSLRLLSHRPSPYNSCTRLFVRLFSSN